MGAPTPASIAGRGPLPRPHSVSADGFRIRHKDSGSSWCLGSRNFPPPLETGPPSVHQSPDKAGSALHVGIKWIKAKRARPTGVGYARSNDLGYKRPQAPGCRHVKKRVYQFLFATCGDVGSSPRPTSVQASPAPGYIPSLFPCVLCYVIARELLPRACSAGPVT